MWTVSDSKLITRPTSLESEGLKLVSEGCDLRKIKNVKRDPKQIFTEVSKTHQAIQTLDKTIASLEMELAAARSMQESIVNGSPISEEDTRSSTERKKYLMVVGVNTAFSSRKRRDSVRATWMPQGEKRKKLEEEKRIIMRFVIGHSTSRPQAVGALFRIPRASEFYNKVDDNVHVNIVSQFRSLTSFILFAATLGHTLVRHKKKKKVHIGCVKPGLVLAQK
ncbi:probable beta-1,3-galactosyltransferase 2 isoform X1 [Tanacetum coccineum]